MSFEKYVQPRDSPCSGDTEHFRDPGKVSRLFLEPPTDTVLLSVHRRGLSFPKFYVSEITQCYTDLASLFSVIFSFISLCLSVFFLLLGKQYFIVCIDNFLLICSHVDGHLGCFQFLTRMSKTDMKRYAQIFALTYIFIFLR